MNEHICAACGHANPFGAVACEACDARLYTAEEAGAAEDFQDEGEPFDPASEPAWAASEPLGPDAEEAAPGEEIPAPSFKGAGDVISPMLAVYRKHFALVGILVLVATVPQALLQFGFSGLMMRGASAESGGGGLVALAALSGLFLWLLAMASSALLSGSLVYAVVDLQRTGRSSAVECLKRGLKVLPKVLLLSVLYALITGAGYILFIVPGVILSLMFAVCIPAQVVEGLGPIAALNRSNELTKGYKGLLFMTYFLWGLLVFFLNIVISWSFADSAHSLTELLPVLLIQTAVLGMLNSTLHVLTVYIYLGLLREQRHGFETRTFTSA